MTRADWRFTGVVMLALLTFLVGHFTAATASPKPVTVTHISVPASCSQAAAVAARDERWLRAENTALRSGHSGLSAGSRVAAIGSTQGLETCK